MYMRVPTDSVDVYLRIIQIPMLTNNKQGYNFAILMTMLMMYISNYVQLILVGRRPIKSYNITVL